MSPPKRKQFFVGSSWHRYFARIADSVPFLPLIFLAPPGTFSSLLKSGEIYYPWTFILSALFFRVIYQIIFLKWRGATPGKMVFGLKLVPYGDFNGKLGWESILLRTLGTDLIEMFTFGLLQYTMFFRKDRRHIYDLLADTVIIQTEPRAIPKVRAIVGLFLLLIGLNGTANTYQQYRAATINSAGIRFHFPQIKKLFKERSLRQNASLRKI